jgi:hypothetical protein
LLGALGGCLLAVAACTPEPGIRSFRVEPPARCGPGEARLSWEATGPARLESEPPVAGLGEVPASGSKTVAVQETTVFELSLAEGAEPRFTRAEVHVISPEVPELFQAAARDCRSGTLLARATVPASQWPDEIVVSSVQSDAAGPVRVSHDGTSALLSPHLASDAFRGMPYRGEWIVEMDGTGERCADAPSSLFLAISLGCQPGRMAP